MSRRGNLADDPHACSEGMRRRDFIAGSAGAAFASSAKRASAQAVGGLKRIGVLVEYEQHDAEARSRLSAFRDGLESLGWIDGRTVLIEYRFGGGDPARIRTFATELAALKPDVMLGSGAPVTGALREVTRTIPIVFVQASDPVGAGRSRASDAQEATSPASPTSNMQWLASGSKPLRGMAPSITRVLVLQNPANFGWPGYTRALEAAALPLAIRDVG